MIYDNVSHLLTRRHGCQVNQKSIICQDTTFSTFWSLKREDLIGQLIWIPVFNQCFLQSATYWLLIKMSYFSNRTCYRARSVSYTPPSFGGAVGPSGYYSRAASVDPDISFTYSITQPRAERSSRHTGRI